MRHEISRESGRESLRTRELNTDLFGEGPRHQELSEMGANLEQVHQLEVKIAENRGQIHELGQHLGQTIQQVNEFFKTQFEKSEKMQAAISRLEQNQQLLVQELTHKTQGVQSQLGERKSLDQKTQEMVDRQNSVLKSFELRLSQMQKIISEKEAALVSAQVSLAEAKSEIARLKRL